jgi:hypothetical protein
VDSPDGLTWTRVPHDEAVFGGIDAQAMMSIAAAGSELVAVGIDAHSGYLAAAVWHRTPTAVKAERD